MKKEPKVKQVLLKIENVRIKEHDNFNLAVERLESVHNPFKKETSNKWVFKGYSPTVLRALQYIQRNELLIDYNALNDLESYLNQIYDSNRHLLDALEEIK